MKNFSMTDLKMNNYANIYRHLYNEGNATRQALALALGMSLPTVNQHLKQLMNKGLVRETGREPSALGRRAVCYGISADARIAVGIEIQKDHIKILAIDLRAEILGIKKAKRHYAQDERYYSWIGHCLDQFLEDFDLDKKRILGVGISIQGLVSLDGSEVTYGKILNCSGLHIKHFKPYIPFPFRLFHDSFCAATSELWDRKSIQHAVFLWLDTHMGSASIINSKVFSGREGRSGFLEHMIIPGPERHCYCGQHNCAECYCAIESILEEGESLEAFNSKRRNSEEGALRRWELFNHQLALLIHNAQTTLDGDIILGGRLSQIISQTDLDRIRWEVGQLTSIPQYSNQIYLGINLRHASARGAAIPYVNQFIRDMDL